MFAAEVLMPQPHPYRGKPVELLQPPAPAPVSKAVKLMFAGAVVAAVFTIWVLILLNQLKTADHSLTASEIGKGEQSWISYGVISIGLWVWMAWATMRGKRWAQIASTVIFGLGTLVTLGFVTTFRSILVILPILEWLVGLGAVIMLWRRESSEFFKHGHA
jgi:hypothetical protein